MPSTLYESVKQSVIEFAEIRKKNQKKQDKMIFRWKLITLALSILFIVMLGLFSQLIASIGKLPDYQYDHSYVLPLLQTVSEQSVPTLSQAHRLIRGITYSSNMQNVHFEWNRASLIVKSMKDVTSIDVLKNKLNGHDHLVFIISGQPNIKFAFFIARKYNNGNGDHEDQVSVKFSTLFNLQTQNQIAFVKDKCPIFSNFQTKVTFLSAITIEQGEDTATMKIQVLKGKESCYNVANEEEAKIAIQKLTGSPPDLTVNSLQIYSLYLDQQS